MSYDLCFRSRSPNVLFSHDDFVRYFGGRSRYQVSESQALYGNEDSGVYFTFDYTPQDQNDEPQDERDSSLIPVAFNLNFFRPHVFALEAEPEVAAFVRALDLTVSDPQNSGMGDGEYSREGFLRGWNAGNAFGYRAMLSQDPTQTLFSLPSAQIEALWRWNFDRQARQSEIGEGAFVPRILFFDAGGKVQTAVVWGDGIPCLIPIVDVVLVPRHDLAPRRLLRTKDDIVMFSWRELDSIFKRFRKRSGNPESFELFYEHIPSDVERAIRDRQPAPAMPRGIAFDSVLDRELLEQAS